MGYFKNKNGINTELFEFNNMIIMWHTGGGGGI